MKTRLLSTLLGATGLFIGTAQAAVVNFDDLNTITTASVNVPYNYAGIAWGTPAWPVLTTINDAFWTASNSFNNVGNGSPSGDNAVFNSGIVDVALANGNNFDFIGAYFTPYTNNNDLSYHGDAALSLKIEGYNGNTLIGTKTLNFIAASYVWLQADLTGLTSLKIIGKNPAVPDYATRWVMDDFTYLPAVSQIPLPQSVWLMLSGLAALGLRRSKRA